MTKVRVWSSEKIYYYNEVEIDGEVNDENVSEEIAGKIEDGSFDYENVDAEDFVPVDCYEVVRN